MPIQHPYQPPDSDPQPPTHVHHRVVMVAALTSFLLYLDRYCFGLAEKFIRDDLRLTTAETSWLQTAFFLSYALAQVPSGWLSDRFGARAMLTFYVLLWSLFTGLCGLVAGFWTFLALRIGFGLGQAGAYPTAGGLLSKWVPYSTRGTANAIVALGGRVGGSLAPVLTAYLIVQFVPASSSSQFSADDLLRPGMLCQRFVANPPNVPAGSHAAAQRELGERLVSGMPSDLAWQIRETAREPEKTPQPPLLDALALELNLRLAGPPLMELDPQIYPNVKLEDEAQRLLAKPEEERTPPERERLNRLILEAVYYPAVRQVYSRGWRPVMMAYGLMGLVVAGAFWTMFRNTPREHPRVNAAEIARIEGPAGPQPVTKAGALPLKQLVSNGSLWLMCLSQFSTNFGWLFVVSLLPRYLDEVHRVPIAARGMMTGVPMLVGCLGTFLGGPFTDRLTRRLGKRWGRSLPLALTRFLAMTAFLFCLLPLTGWQATAAMALMAVSVDLGVPATWAYAQDVGGKYTGSILGWGNMWGNFGAALSPIVLDRLIGAEGNWHLVFMACAGMLFISGLASLGIDATKRVAD